MADKPKQQSSKQYTKDDFNQDKTQVAKAREEKKKQEEIKKQKELKENRIECGGGMCEVCGGTFYACMPMIGD